MENGTGSTDRKFKETFTIYRQQNRMTIEWDPTFPGLEDKGDPRCGRRRLVHKEDINNNNQGEVTRVTQITDGITRQRRHGKR